MNRIIKLGMVLAGVGIALLFAGCGSNTPDNVANELVDCFRAADFDGVSKLSTGDFKKGAEVLREVVKDREKAEECKKEFSGKKIEIGRSEINGDKATISVLVDGKDKRIELIRIGGVWKVADFDI